MSNCGWPSQKQAFEPPKWKDGSGSEADLISTLRRERQLEIGVQKARKRRPDLSDDALLELAKIVRGFTRSAFGQERLLVVSEGHSRSDLDSVPDR